MIKLPMQFEDAYSLQSFLGHYSAKESTSFRKWVDAALDWAERNTIEMHPVCRDGDWGFKIILHDSMGRFFDYVEPIKVKKRESDVNYADRVWTALSNECASIRLLRIQNRVGQPAVDKGIRAIAPLPEDGKGALRAIKAMRRAA